MQNNLRMSQLIRYLRQDEKILWSGKPDVIPFIFSGYAGFSIVGFFWLIFALLMISAIPTTGAPAPFMFFTVLFILLGLCVALGPAGS
jgi:hypothetical protein